jgi:hypothetical protein
MPVMKRQLRYPATLVKTTPGDLTVTNEQIVIVKKTTGQATAVTLPKAALEKPGRTVLVVDGKGDAATNNITVRGAGADTINGGATFVLSVNFAAAEFLFNGTGWNKV